MKNNQATDTLNYNDTYLQPEFYRNRLNTANFSNGIYYPQVTQSADKCKNAAKNNWTSQDSRSKKYYNFQRNRATNYNALFIEDEVLSDQSK